MFIYPIPDSFRKCQDTNIIYFLNENNKTQLKQEF